MERYYVSMEQHGSWVPVGTIEGEDSYSARFAYSARYRERPDAAAVSVRLPLQEEPFSPAATRIFFEGLLPEGFTRRAVAEWMRADEDDYLAILHGLGRECLGALLISRPGDPLQAGYERISHAQVRALAEEGATRSAELVTRAHLSLTGASGKVGLYYDPDENCWYLPHGTAPSTHIVKQSHIRLRDIVTNEQLIQMTAARCGLDVPESFIVNTGAGADGDVLLATARFDRRFPEEPVLIDGLPRPLRLHQEDLAQALGIPAARKYERSPEEGYLRAVFELLRRVSSNPIEDQLKFWDRLVFNYLAGNTDAHLKNFSLLYGPGGREIRLAPAYDQLSTAVYESSTRDMAFSIGGDTRLEAIGRGSFARAAAQVGLSSRLALARFDRLAEHFVPALRASAQELSSLGFPAAGRLEERILRAGGIARL